MEYRYIEILTIDNLVSSIYIDKKFILLELFKNKILPFEQTVYG